MGKLLKYCSSCDEGFAERFAFCPDCGDPLQTVEMNPVGDEVVAKANAPESKFEMLHPVVNEVAVDEFAGVEEQESPVVQAEPVNVPHVAEVLYEPEQLVEATAAGSYFEAPPTEAFSVPAAETASYHKHPYNSVPDEIYHLTVIDDRNSRQKNGLLLGATTLMLVALLTGTVVSIFSKSIDIGSIGSGDVFSWIPEVDPISIDLELEKQKKDDSGGGGGGNEEKDPASKGALPAMMKNPDVAPSTRMDRLDNPTLTLRVGVNGPDQPKVDTTQPYGLPNGADKLSDGSGSGGGIGTGRNGGVGSGDGPGLGSGSGGGAGPGTGGGTPGGGDPPPPELVRETTPVKILSKPKAPYTDAARQNNVQGSVTLKIVFLASGQIGSITAVTRLPYGLTENAIAAARQIRFEPKKINGRPQTTSMTFQYGFNIY